MTIALTPVENIEDINDIDVGLRSLETTAAEDLLRGLSKRDLWARLGWLDVKRRYRRTTIGPFWTSITLAVYVVTVGTVGAALWHQDIYEYLPFLVSGMIAWTLVSSIIMESCSLLIAGQPLFRSIRFDYSILAYALVWRNFLVLLHNFVVYFLVVLLLKPSLLGVTALLAVPGLALVFVNGVWIALLLGMICLRYRDVPPLVNSAIQISMLITPLFWPAETLVGSKRVVFVDINPLYHVVDVVRAPLLGRVPANISYVVMIAMTIVGWWGTYAMFKRFRRRIAYWS
ncbi:ABC transporter permease [Bradyrhizobium diazoefficiens]|uniref:ABC transporter permease n=1 Tax=Bradyrhizobium diazoefficiens TaxID=1355477 RepID=UPI000BE84F3A|nr:ABC transporter permease [Bradyrhizobium diazoefficiens]PDT58075.1 ABC transporter permease [Bradyrhizobium diazoefficiens]